MHCFIFWLPWLTFYSASRRYYISFHIFSLSFSSFQSVFAKFFFYYSLFYIFSTRVFIYFFRIYVLYFSLLDAYVLISFFYFHFFNRECFELFFSAFTSSFMINFRLCLCFRFFSSSFFCARASCYVEFSLHCMSGQR